MFLLALASKPGLAFDPAIEESVIQTDSDITVLADESLRIPLARIARDYTGRTRTAVTVWFASAGVMTNAIREGADADIVITADEDALKALESSGQIDVYATQGIVTSPLVIAVAAGDEPREGTIDLMQWRYREDATFRLVAIESEHSLEQRLSKRVFAESELLKARKVEPIIAQDVAQAVRLMEREDAPGLLLAVDVFSRPNLRVVQRFPDIATYKAAVLAGERMAASRDFIHALRGMEALTIFSAYGLSLAAAEAR